MNTGKRKNLLLFALAAETITVSYGLLPGLQTGLVSVLYLLAGLLFIFCVLTLPRARLPSFREIRKPVPIQWAAFVVMIFLAFITSRYWLEKIPIDPDFADMLPVIKVMNERLLQGHWKQVYDPIIEIWNGTRPIYLPAMWVPYLPAVAMQTDMRWVTVGALLISFTLILLLFRFRKKEYRTYFLLAITGILFWWIFSDNEIHGLITMSEEGVVILYFVLLTIAVVSENALLMGLAASLCLLSRYSMIGWLLPCLIYFIAGKQYKKAFLFSVTGLLCFLFFFVFPFGLNTLHQMISLPGNYVAFARHVWEMTPEVYWLNPGMGKFFGAGGMATLHKCLLVLSFSVPLWFMIFCLRQKKGRFQNINLACFKLSLLIFYQFIDVPYGYLFYTSSFVSLVIAACLYAAERREVVVEHL